MRARRGSYRLGFSKGVGTVLEIIILGITQRDLLVMLIVYPACIGLLGVYACFDPNVRRRVKELFLDSTQSPGYYILVLLFLTLMITLVLVMDEQPGTWSWWWLIISLPILVLFIAMVFYSIARWPNFWSQRPKE